MYWVIIKTESNYFFNDSSNDYKSSYRKAKLFEQSQLIL